jgi:hypothetical protein
LHIFPIKVIIIHIPIKMLIGTIFPIYGLVLSVVNLIQQHLSPVLVLNWLV